MQTFETFFFGKIKYMGKKAAKKSKNSKGIKFINLS